MTAHERLEAWLAHHGHKVQKRQGREFVRVERKSRGPMKIYLRLTANGWVAAGDRKSHRSSVLERLILEFNDAERVVSGKEGDRLDERIRQHLAALPDSEVQLLADSCRSEPPLTLADIGAVRTLAVIGKQYVPYANLSSLVVAMRYREAYLAEPARRDVLMERAS